MLSCLVLEFSGFLSPLCSLFFMHMVFECIHRPNLHVPAPFPPCFFPRSFSTSGNFSSVNSSVEIVFLDKKLKRHCLLFDYTCV